MYVFPVKFIERLVMATAVIIAAAAILVASSQIAAAQAFGADVELTPQIVENFMQSYPEVRGIADTYESENKSSGASSDNPAEAFGAYLSYQGAMAQFDGAVQKYGFPDMMQWINTMAAIATAMAFAEEGSDMDGQMAEAIEQIKANDQLTKDQKTMMLQQLGAASASMSAMRPSDENLAAVGPYAEDLKIMFEMD